MKKVSFLAVDLLKPDSKEHYMASAAQKTVHKLHDGCHGFSDDHTGYQEILSDEGLKLFNAAEAKFRDGEFKDTLVNYRLNYNGSGSWSSSTDDSVHGLRKSPGGGDIRGVWHSRDNISIVGESLLNPGNFIETSICVFYTDEWCMTSSGSVYKLFRTA